jgi:hypothetical protein
MSRVTIHSVLQQLLEGLSKAHGFLGASLHVSSLALQKA